MLENDGSWLYLDMHSPTTNKLMAKNVRSYYKNGGDNSGADRHLDTSLKDEKEMVVGQSLCALN